MAKKKKQKTNRRNSAKNPALEPKFTLKSRLEYLDYDYLDRLNTKERAWLNKFTNEELGAAFSENNKDNLNKTDKEKQIIYTRNNKRNNDVLTYKKTRKMLDYVGDKELERIEVDMEDTLISNIDRKRGK